MGERAPLHAGNTHQQRAGCDLLAAGHPVRPRMVHPARLRATDQGRRADDAPCQARYADHGRCRDPAQRDCGISDRNDRDSRVAECQRMARDVAALRLWGRGVPRRLHQGLHPEQPGSDQSGQVALVFGILATSFFADEGAVRPASQYISTTQDWGIKLPLVVVLLVIWFIVTATSNAANLTRRI